MNEAEDRLKGWIKAHIEMSEAKPDRARGSDWFQLSPCEEEVFGLSVGDMARAVAIHEAYEAIAGIAENDLFHDQELCSALRKIYPWITQGTSLESEFRQFAALFDLEQKTAFAFYWKHGFWLMRQGIMNFTVPGDTEKES